MATFAQPTPDENLQPGWTTQGTGPAQSTTGIPGQGYATSGAVPASVALSSALQGSAGFPNPPGASNIGSENSGAYTVSILTNPGYADGNTLMNAAPLTAPVPGTTAVQNPYGMNASVTLVIPSGVTGVYVAPYSATAPSGTGSPWVLVSSGGVAETLNFSVPPAGWIKTTGVNATSVSYQATN